MIKDVFLQSLVQINSIPVLIIVFLIFFLKLNYRYEKELSKKFIPSVILLLALILVDNLDYYAYDSLNVTGIFDLFHRVSAMLGYDIRIILMASLLAIAANRNINCKRISLLTYLPSLVNVLILLPCLFTDLFFYYNPDGSIGRGMFAYEPHILSALYISFLFFLAYICKRRNRNSEMAILTLCGILTILGFLAEFLFALRGILIGVVALDITFYYLYLHIENFRFDALTEIFNRDAFLADVERHGKNRISHILSIDLNGLKVINDTLGHNEGDKALKTIGKTLLSARMPNCYVYRVGGDEFAAICIKASTEDVEKMIENMYAQVSATGYSCAIGYACWNTDKSFTEVYKEADDKMYIAKRKMKNTFESVISEK